MTILIKNVQLIDGTGKPPFKSDVLIKRDRIFSVGSFYKYRAGEVIDGAGAYLAPGFIDIHSSADHYLTIFSNPSREDLLFQGVTSIIGGHDGVSLAPHISLDLIKEWVDVRKVNIHWHTTKEFFAVLRKRQIGVNFGTLVGYKTLCQFLRKQPSEHLTKKDLKALELILGRSLGEGAFGLSIGVDYLKEGEVRWQEVKELLEIITKLNSLFVADFSRLKDEPIVAANKFINSIEEIGTRVLISHLQPTKGFESDYEKIIDLISAKSAHSHIFFDIYPDNSTVIPAFSLLSLWVSKVNSTSRILNRKAILESLEEPGIREKILKELPMLRGNEIKIVSAPGHQYLAGTLLKDFSRNRGQNMSQGLLNLIGLTNAGAIISMRNVGMKTLVSAVSRDRGVIGSADNHLGNIDKAVFPKFLELIVRGKILPIESVIYKMTGLPAQILGIPNRGLVKSGYFADLVLFRDSEIREVIVNGMRAVKEGKFQDILAGKVLVDKS